MIKRGKHWIVFTVWSEEEWNVCLLSVSQGFLFSQTLQYTVSLMKILSLIADAHLVVATSFMSHVRIYIISRSPLSIDWRHSSKCKIIKLKVECDSLDLYS